LARFDGGWVKLHRKAALGDINSNFGRGGLFFALIAMANRQESTVSWNGKPRTLGVGEIITSITELSEMGDVDRRTIDKYLGYLSLRGTISVERSSGGVAIKINNYETYQVFDAEGPQRGRNDMYNGMPNGVAHIGEYNNTRNEELSLPGLEPGPPQKKPAKKKGSDKTERNRRIWDAWELAYSAAYNGKKPLRDVIANTQISKLGDRLGEADAIKVLEFYVRHKKSYYAQNAHALWICLKDVEPLRMQMLNGKQITEADVRNYESKQRTATLIDKIQNGEVKS